MASSVSVIGAGAVGTALAGRLRRAGFSLAYLVCRSRASALLAVRAAGGGRPSADPVQAARAASWVVLALPEAEIPGVCCQIARAGGFAHRPRVLHVAGASGRGILAAARRAGCPVAAAHPLAAFPDRGIGPSAFDRLYWGVDADPSRFREFAGFVRKLGGRPLRIRSKDRPLYHLAAVFASNHVAAELSLASSLLAMAGIPRRRSLEALLPLAEGTLRNLRTWGLPRAVTGPASRGDIETIRKHLAALARRPCGLKALYRLCAAELVRLGLRKGSVSRRGASEVMSLLSGA